MRLLQRMGQRRKACVSFGTLLLELFEFSIPPEITRWRVVGLGAGSEVGENEKMWAPRGWWWRILVEGEVEQQHEEEEEEEKNK